MSLIDMMRRHPLLPTIWLAVTAFRSTVLPTHLDTTLRRWPQRMTVSTSSRISSPRLYPIPRHPLAHALHRFAEVRS
jgi:hypothetical protein